MTVWAPAALAILDRLLGWLPFIAAYVAGKRAQRLAALEIMEKVRRVQLEIAARPRASHDRIIERLRRDGAL